MAFNICTDGESDDDGDVTSCGDDADVSDVIDPFGKVFENVPSETHKLEPVANCEHYTAKKFQFEPPGFCCRSGKIHLPTPDTPPELMGFGQAQMLMLDTSTQTLDSLMVISHSHPCIAT